MANYTFRQGHYYMAGVDKPFYAPTGMIVDKVEEMGFKVLTYGECEKFGAGGRLPFSTGGNACGEQYDWIGLAERVGPDQMIDLPSEVKWIQGWSKTPTPAPQPGQPTQPQQPTEQPYTAPPTPMSKNGGSDMKAAAGDVDWRIPAAVLGGLGGLLLARWWTRRR
jgi:hypothetical protein